MSESSGVFDSFLNDAIQLLRKGSNRNNINNSKRVVAAICFSILHSANTIVPVEWQGEGKNREPNDVILSGNDGTDFHALFSDISEYNLNKEAGSPETVKIADYFFALAKHNLALVINPWSDKIAYDSNQVKKIVSYCQNQSIWKCCSMDFHGIKAKGIDSPFGFLVYPGGYV